MLRPLKHIAKRSLQHIAANFGHHKRVSADPELLILMYHRILPKQDSRSDFEEPGMIVTPETFTMHLKLIQQHFHVISLAQWITKKNNGERLPSRCCAITFDDGWSDNYEFAYPILKQYGLPATIFLVSDMIGTKQQFWPERLARVLNTVATTCPEQWDHNSMLWLQQEACGYQFKGVTPDREQLSELIRHIKHYSDDEIHASIDRIQAELGLDLDMRPSLLNWQQLNEMCNSGLIDAGSHTLHHIRLNASQDEDILEKEIRDSKIQIEQQLGRPVETFCYPNGDHCDRSIELVKQYYSGAVTTSQGWNRPGDDEYLLKRIGIHEDIGADKTAFLARISGWM